jgi:hypothetical protein
MESGVPTEHNAKQYFFSTDEIFLRNIEHNLSILHKIDSPVVSIKICDYPRFRKANLFYPCTI